MTFILTSSPQLASKYLSLHTKIYGAMFAGCHPNIYCLGQDPYGPTHLSRASNRAPVPIPIAEVNDLMAKNKEQT